MTVSSTLIIKKGLTCILGGFGKSSGTANRVAGRCISTVNATELQFYDQQSTSDWWDRKHPFWALQRYNRLRVPFIERHIARYGRKTLAEARVLDVGCGGGYLSEALAREGATVTGIDASSRAIEVCERSDSYFLLSTSFVIQVAEGHRQKELVDALLSTKEKQGLERLSYFQADVDSISAQDQSFDVVVASEVVEHVDHVSHFLRRCTALLKPGGLLVITTPNRTPLAYISVIFMAEYVLKLLPKVRKHCVSRGLHALTSAASAGLTELFIIGVSLKTLYVSCVNQNWYATAVNSIVQNVNYRCSVLNTLLARTAIVT